MDELRGALLFLALLVGLYIATRPRRAGSGLLRRRFAPPWRHRRRPDPDR